MHLLASLPAVLSGTMPSLHFPACRLRKDNLTIPLLRCRKLSVITYSLRPMQMQSCIIVDDWCPSSFLKASAKEMVHPVQHGGRAVDRVNGKGRLGRMPSLRLRVCQEAPTSRPRPFARGTRYPRLPSSPENRAWGLGAHIPFAF